MTTQPGLGVDAAGNPVIDPTKNVLDLVDASVKRLDDMLTASISRLDDLRTLTLQDVRREMQMRADYDEKLRVAESERINAIRLVDTQQVQRAAEVQATQALALANQVAVSAETVRTQVAATLVQSDGKLAEALDPIRKDIADLRRVQYETAGGRTQVIDHRQGQGVMIAALSVAGLFAFGLIGIAITLLAR